MSDNQKPSPKKVETPTALVPPNRVSLAEILAQNPPETNLRGIKNEQRVRVITLVAKIDDDLLRLLEVTLTPSNNDQDDLLREGGIIGSLGLRAKLCMRLGLISPALYKLIRDLSDIRNDCSHKPVDFHVFAEQGTVNKIDSYWNRMNPELFNRNISQPEKRFDELCSYISTLLSLAVQDSKSRVFLNSEILFAQ